MLEGPDRSWTKPKRRSTSVLKEDVKLVGLRENGADNRKRQVTEGNSPKETQQNIAKINCM